MKGLTIVRPLTVTDTMLVSSTVPENDHAAWNSGTTYALGDRVILTSTHKIYESLQASNLNKNPTTEPLWWVEVSPTNRWKVFDTSNSTQTKQSTSISYTLAAGVAIDSISILNISFASSIRIRLVDPTFGTVYDKTTDVSAKISAPEWWQWFFGLRVAPTLSVATDLPSFPTANLIIDITGGTDLAIGVILFGQSRTIGLGIQTGANVGIVDYSRKEANDFGDTVLVQRAFSKRAQFDMTLLADEVDGAVSFLSAIRAVPCLWIGSEKYEATVLYGYYKTFNILISYPTFSDCSLEIEGLT